MEPKQILMLGVFLLSAIVGSIYLVYTLIKLDHAEENGENGEHHDHH